MKKSSLFTTLLSAFSSAMLLSSFLTAVLAFTIQDSIQLLLSKMSLETLAIVFSILVIAVLSLIATLLKCKVWLTWDEVTGTWCNRFSNVRYCANCHSKGVTSPLRAEATHWRCMSCSNAHSRMTARIDTDQLSNKQKPKQSRY